MAAETEQLVVDLIARVSQFERDIKRAEGTGTRSFTALRRESMTATKAMEADFTRSAGRINQAMQSTQSAAGGLTRSLGMMMRAGPLAGVASVGGGLAALNAIKTELLALEALSKRTGMTVNAVNGMNLLGARNGVSAQVIGQGLEGLADKLAEAARGEGELGKLFDLNNIKLKDRNGQVLSTNEALAKAAELFRNARNESDKIKIAELLGLSKEWIPILERGAEAFRKAQADAAAAAGTIDRELIRKAQEFDAAWNKGWADWTAWSKAKIMEAGSELMKLIRLAGQLPAALMGAGTGPRVLRDSDLRPGETRGQPAGSLRDPSTDAYVAELTRQQAIRSGAPLTGGVTRLPTSGGGGGGGGASDLDTAKKRLDSYIDSLARQDAVLQAQIATFGQSEAAQKAAAEIARAQVDLNRLDAATRAEVTKRLTEQVHSSEALRKTLEDMQRAQRQAIELNEFSRDSFKGLLTDTVSGLSSGKNIWQSFGDAGVRQLQRISEKLIQMATDQLWLSAFGGGGGLFGGGGGGGLFGALFGGLMGGGSTGTQLFAQGAAFSAGRVVPFASGGVVTAATAFPMAGGRTGVMGERGPEAIMPLRRTPSGGLGVAAIGGGGATVNFSPVTNITVQGNADSGTVASIRAELDRRDQRIRQEVPSLVNQGRRDRTIKG